MRKRFSAKRLCKIERAVLHGKTKTKTFHMPNDREKRSFILYLLVVFPGIDYQVHVVYVCYVHT